jgi:hypothetical protein
LDCSFPPRLNEKFINTHHRHIDTRIHTRTHTHTHTHTHTYTHSCCCLTSGQYMEVQEQAMMVWNKQNYGPLFSITGFSPVSSISFLSL